MNSALARGDTKAARLRLLDRSALFAALSEAVSPESPRSVLVVFAFEGLSDILENTPYERGEELLGVLSRRLRLAIGSSGRVFMTRRGEFCALFDGGLGAVRLLLATIASDLDADSRAFGVRSSLGIAVLPEEATLPSYALALADRRLRALSGDLRVEHGPGGG